MIERRLRICNMGAIGGGGSTEWTTDEHDPAAVAFREEHADLRCLDRCPTPPIDWEFHTRHLLIEEREVPDPKPWWRRLLGTSPIGRKPR